MAKGEIPITKNVNVVDSQGNKYEATYPKRAQGLVKKGRARFIDENTICLACPPNEYLEDIEMSENKNINKEAVEQANAEKNTLTARDVWDQIVKLQDQLSNIEEIVRSINMLDTKDMVYNDDGELICDYSTEATMEKIKTMQSAIVSRETTLQKMLDYYFSIFRKMSE